MNVLKTEIAIRGYTERPDREPLGHIQPKRELEMSDTVVVFDCETTIDASQQLRVGFFQIRESSELAREGVFFDGNAITQDEEAFIRRYASQRDLELLTVSEFRTDILIEYGYDLHATIVGFNLPFDVSRIALNHGVARRDKRGGYTFLLTREKNDPRIRVKYLNPGAAMIDFSKRGKPDAPRGTRKRGTENATYRGHFVDLKTLATALLSRRGISLRSLAEELETPTQKHETEEHGEITEAYLEYAQADVQVTWECFIELSHRYDEYGLSQPMSKVMSEASIGKAILQEMGIRPFLGCDPEFPRERFGEIMCAYYGGRAEVRWRRTIREVLYCDFKSMYPTVNALMGLWDFVIADGGTPVDSTEETRDFLESVTVEDLQRPETWQRLHTFVKIRPDHDVLPVRAKYDSRTNTIGLNYLTLEEPLWYTLADAIVSKLLTGKSPTIEKAITYYPGAVQQGLKRVKILGKDKFEIDPVNDDLFTRIIDLRDLAKSEQNPIQQTLKIIANSTSYGIFIEINRDDAPKPEKLNLYDFNGDCSQIDTTAIEEPGKFFHPLLGVLITGAARLMLGIAEKLVINEGLDYTFCDTDSIAIVRPEGISADEFREKSKKIVDWFKPLNPYEKQDSILKIEDINNGINSNEPEPLYCFAISAKRYALFNLAKCGNPVIRKASAHGLGHLVAPYTEADAPGDIPAPGVPLKETGLGQRWQYDFWFKILKSALAGHPDQVPLDWHPALQTPAAIRYTASSPELLKWMKKYNDGKPYDEQIKPFGFLLMFSESLFDEFPDLDDCEIEQSKRGRPKKTTDIKPVSPYDKNPTLAVANVFDRATGNPVDPSQLRTYAEALCQYHFSPESKFDNGKFSDYGRTERRHVFAAGIVLIGKEANRVGESGEEYPASPGVTDFGLI